ncbi:phosphate/phosphite/phosphonate ABC transporter substrate-binding protein [Paucibacter soli]|uniref:phosphate/phosphite/phosphonate ABC transporter substrate-binding protein n=1 Tax=Paucibacter soli TaxID=3133433 RepID=UPI003094E44A
MLRALLGLLLLWPVLGHCDYAFAVNAPRLGNKGAQWEELANHFAAWLGQPVKVVGQPPNRIGRELATGHLDFALVNPVTAVELIQGGTAVPIASLKLNGSTQFAGAIIVHRDSPIQSVHDLRGRQVLAYQERSAGAYLFQMYHLIQSGYDPRVFLGRVRQGINQDIIPILVAEQRVDVGFVRSGILEALQREGRLDTSRIRVLDERRDLLAERHSTDLYPEWILVSASHASQAVLEKLRRAALSVTPEMSAARAAGIDGFVPPLKLDGVERAMRALGLLLPRAKCSTESAGGCPRGVARQMGAGQLELPRGR